ncbi:MAG: hypothetical protein IKS32_06620 [Solobacterium sp.]|nr:hypothetical protein [Solobacterium sp.]
MANAQMQTEQKPQELPEPEEPRTDAQPERKHPVSEAEKDRKFIRRASIALGTFIIAVSSIRAGMYAKSHNRIPMMLEAEPGYLSLKEFALEDPETGKPVQTMTNADYASKYTFKGDTMHYRTFRGVKAGDTWYTFAEAYGDCIPSRIEIEPGDKRGIYTAEPGITVDDFYDSYILSGEVNLSGDEVHIVFFTGTDGVKLYHDAEELSRKSDAFFHSPRILHPLEWTDDYAGYELSFRFGPDWRGDGRITLIYSGKIDL